jgi:hypothetical protein
MTARAKSLRDTIINAINTAKSGLVITGFDLTLPAGTHVGKASNFHLPELPLEDLTTSGRVWVIALVGDQNPPMDRNFGCTESLPIQVCYQCKITNLLDADFIDIRIELTEQLKKVVRKAEPNWCNWMRTEAIKDDNGTPHNFVIMREDSVFMCVFTAYFEMFLDSEE